MRKRREIVLGALIKRSFCGRMVAMQMNRLLERSHP